MPRPRRREEYTVGWVRALAVELAAAQEMFDDEHITPACDAHDSNIYSCDNSANTTKSSLAYERGRWAPMFVVVLMFLAWPAAATRPPARRARALAWAGNTQG
jgi:hypothetical protein